VGPPGWAIRRGTRAGLPTYITWPNGHVCTYHPCANEASVFSNNFLPSTYASTSVLPAVLDLRLGMRLQPVKALFANQTNNFTITYSSSSSRALLGLIFAHQNQGQQTLVLSSIPAEAFLLTGVNDQVHVWNGDGGLSMGSEPEIEQVTSAEFDQSHKIRTL